MNGGEFFQNNNANKKDKAELPSFFADQTEETFEESLLEDGLEVNKQTYFPTIPIDAEIDETVLVMRFVHLIYLSIYFLGWP